jgi:hypothetical protein
MLKKILPVILVVIMVSLSGCNFSLPGMNQAPAAGATPTLTDEQMQAEIERLLTTMPTATLAAPEVATATPDAAAPDDKQPIAATNTPEAEVQPAAPTETPVPAAPEATATQAATPTVTNTSAPTATLDPKDPRARLGSPTKRDTMDSAEAWTWPTGTSEFTTMDFKDGQMVFTGPTTKLGWRLANPAGYGLGNMYLEMVVNSGSCGANDQYGVLFRSPVLQDADRGYLFGFTCDGRYALRRWDGKDGEKGKMTWLKQWTADKAIVSGANQNNRMGLLVSGSRISLYANGVLLAEFTDATWTAGYLGVYIGAVDTKNYTIRIDEMAYWENP